jgi:hypothetical protein
VLFFRFAGRAKGFISTHQANPMAGCFSHAGGGGEPALFAAPHEAGHNSYFPCRTSDLFVVTGFPLWHKCQPNTTKWSWRSDSMADDCKENCNGDYFDKTHAGAGE